MKKIFALLLALSMVFALAACGGGKTCEGTWNASLNLAELAGDELGDMGELFKDINVAVNLDLNKDKSYVLSIDAASALPAIREAVKSYLTKVAEEQGISLEQLEELSGQTLDAMLDEAMQEANFEELSQTFKGTYTEEGGKLTLNPEEAGGQINTATWENDTLTMDAGGKTITFTRK